jgi:PIN domain nuclease of toxin-antitoxin system
MILMSLCQMNFGLRKRLRSQHDRLIMKFLLDTHTFIWADLSPEKLSQSCRDLLLDRENILLLSLASVWEMQIKLQLGKLNLRIPLPDLIREQQQVNRIQLLRIELDHIWELARLENHHRDPFDRLLIAQAIVEDISILSDDRLFDRYPVKRLW